MQADELLLTLLRNDVSLSVEGSHLRYFSETEISGELIRQMKEHKERLISLLQTIQHFGAHIGETVTTFQGDGIIWGVSAYGVEVLHPGRYVAIYNPLELALLNCVAAEAEPG